MLPSPPLSRSPHRPRLVGVVHLPPLPGSPRSRATTAAIASDAAADARALEDGGFDHVILENFGDAPFYRGSVPPITVAAMTACALAVRSACPSLALGINVLRNDAEAALAVAVAVGAAFVRVNVLTGARVTDQGVIEGVAAELLRTRRALDAAAIALWADVDVKHSAALAPRALAAEAKDTVHRALAEVVLVTGEGTGIAVDVERLGAVRAAVPEVPVLVASGARAGMLPALSPHCDGVIVGSALRESGVAGGRVDPGRAKAFADAFRQAWRDRPMLPIV